MSGVHTLAVTTDEITMCAVSLSSMVVSHVFRSMSILL